MRHRIADVRAGIEMGHVEKTQPKEQKQVIFKSLAGEAGHVDIGKKMIHDYGDQHASIMSFQQTLNLSAVLCTVGYHKLTTH